MVGAIMKLRNEHYEVEVENDVIVACSIHTPYRQGWPHMRPEYFIGDVVEKYNNELYAAYLITKTGRSGPGLWLKSVEEA